MKVSEEVPHQWHSYFEAANFESFRDVAASAGVSPSTAIACLKPGRRQPGRHTVDKVAGALRMTGDKLRELRGDPDEVPFDLPTESSILGAPERRAVVEVVRAFTQMHDREHQARMKHDDVMNAVADAIVKSLHAQIAFFRRLAAIGVEPEVVSAAAKSISPPLFEAVQGIISGIEDSTKAILEAGAVAGEMNRLIRAASSDESEVGMSAIDEVGEVLEALRDDGSADDTGDGHQQTR